MSLHNKILCRDVVWILYNKRWAGSFIMKSLCSALEQKPSAHFVSDRQNSFSYCLKPCPSLFLGYAILYFQQFSVVYVHVIK